MEEWLEFHLLMGIGHFYLFNHDSSDCFLEVLTPYINAGVVTLTNWPSSNNRKNWVHDQIRAYNQCIKNTLGTCEWLAIIDLDEFIVPVKHLNLIDFLNEFDYYPQIAAIEINWQLYGSSGYKTLPKNALLIETLTWKAPTQYNTPFLSNTKVKSIVRPEAVVRYYIHGGKYKSEYEIYSPRLLPSKLSPIEIDRIRINHYWTRNEDYFFYTKVKRRIRAGIEMNDYQKILEDLCQVEDKIMHRFTNELKKKINASRSQFQVEGESNSTW